MHDNSILYTKMDRIIDAMNNYDIMDYNDNCGDELMKRTIIMLNIKKINNSWKKSTLYLSSPDLKNDKRYLKVKTFLLNGELIKPPTIDLKDNGDIKFEDGRHRFSILRDLGYLEIPFIVYEEEKDQLIENFR